MPFPVDRALNDADKVKTGLCRDKKIINQVKSFLLVYGAVETTINNRWGGGDIWEGSLGCEFFAWVDVC